MKQKTSLLAAMAATAFICAGVPASAEGFISEVRLGVMDHDSSMFHDSHETSDPDINAEIRFVSPDFLAWAFAPRPLIGGTVNTGNGTSFGYAGLGWTFDLTDAFFIDLTFGGAVHDGSTKGRTATSKDYGCRAQFHESGSIGYRFDKSNALMLTVEHMSNGGLCKRNEGLTNTGIRYAYTF
ncbi:MAG: acyloxyacyl hydrolase [Parvibaculum sp.]|uniref:acyloxyacyl hydrolase n=1 Tax=Parvibaculum sp. TaxID=2024848 RepID=UPI001D8047C3|nr:acyloxyacyl hydrolase [Parvibaculum sp.]MBX3489413.1 acyloxyacyl hydrolase [Parvibaculum sp.]MBX3495532.1 acyloxyacyl hydrolase [Parvibaculum sp.]MCW5726631.1 acyloxyacyl hydrolase [Parvibaculum sp.]